MEFSVHLTHYRKAGAPEPAIEFAQQAEELGFNAVWVGDHIVHPEHVDTWYPNGGPNDIRTTQASGAMPDVFVTLGVIGGKTKKVRLGTSVLVVPYRPPLHTAKQIATLDALTGGRVILGIGSGWHKQEFEALGIPFEERGPRTDEAIAIWKRVWTGDNVDFHGKFNTFETLFVLPKPVQEGGPPIWVGGHSKPAKRRTALLGDGWFPTRVRADEYKPQMDEIRQMAAEAGRPAPTAAFTRRMKIVDKPDNSRDPFDSQMPLIGTPDQVIEVLRAYEAAGVQHMKLSGSSEDSSEIPMLMERFSREVLPAFQ